MQKLLIFVSFFSFLISSAQFDFGIKAGLNYNSIDDLNVSGGFAGFDENINSEGQLGFHAGIVTQFNFTKFYLKGELLYVQNSSSYDDTLAPSSTLKLSTLELPVLFGFKVVGPLKLYVGPSLVYNIDSDFADFFDLQFEKDLSIAINLGTTVTFDRIDIDLRYSSGLSENTASYLDDIPVDGLGYTINTRPSQFLLSLAYKIN
jgi:hypothetical protein